MLKETPVSHVVDGGIGELAVARTMERAIEKAKRTGLTLGTLRNSNNWVLGHITR